MRRAAAWTGATPMPDRRWGGAVIRRFAIDCNLHRKKNAEIATCSDESLIYQSNNDAAQRYKRLH